MKNLQVFKNKEFGEIRTLSKNGEPWLVGKDVATALGFANTRDAIKTHVHEDDKGVDLIDTPGGRQNATTINESGLYALIFGSRLPEAHKFKRWVTSEVLPAIRKTGGYIATKADDSDEEIMARAYLIAQETLKRRDEKIHQLEATAAYQGQIILELTPKASYYDIVLQSSQLQPITLISKDYGMSGQYMNKLLAELGVQYRLHDTWVLYQDYASRGYTQSKTHVVNDDKTVMHTYWTQKGRLFIYELLKTKKGILPMIERYETA